MDASLHDLLKAVSAAPHGGRGAMVKEWAQASGCSVQTAYRKLRQAGYSPYALEGIGAGLAQVRPRKRRTDTGARSLTRDEAQKIAMAVRHGISATGKRRVDITEAVRWLRDNGMIRAERVDPQTGECIPLSLSSIRRAMKDYRLDAETLAKPAPHQPLASLHPNHV